MSEKDDNNLTKMLNALKCTAKNNDFISEFNDTQSDLEHELLRAISSERSDANNHIITSIAGIDDTRMPGLLIKPILLLDYIYHYKKYTNIISNDACEWLITNMNDSMLALKAGACNAGLTAVLIKNAYDFIFNNNEFIYNINEPHQLLRVFSRMLMTAYNMKDTNLYANTIVASVFIKIVFIELNKVNYNDDYDYIDKMDALFSEYKNLKTTSEFISSELSHNLDKPIEFINELVKVNIQDILE